MEMNPINVLRRLGLIETLAFRFADAHGDHGGWDFDNTYEYYVYMALKTCWLNMR